VRPCSHDFGLLIAADRAGLAPPVLQVTPTQTVGADQPVVEEHRVGLAHDLDIVVDRVAQPQVRLNGDAKIRLFGRPKTG
jgi:hypothetical protein